MLSLVKPGWPAPKNIVAFTTTRRGGISEGLFRGLNVGAHVGDVPERVSYNRTLLPASDKLRWLEQVHGSRCVNLTESSLQTIPVADAAISMSSHFYCAIMTADCVPVLICNRDGTEVGAIHAGWQGIVKGVIENTIAEMRTAPEQLVAWIGPAISQRYYQVGEKVAKHFKQWPHLQTAADEKGKCYLDLPAIAESVLRTAQVGWVGHSHLCTYRDPARFYSHRFAQHAGQPATGRMVSVVGITE